MRELTIEDVDKGIAEMRQEIQDIPSGENRIMRIAIANNRLLALLALRKQIEHRDMTKTFDTTDDTRF